MMDERDRIIEEEHFQNSMIQAQCDDAEQERYNQALDEYWDEQEHQERRERGDVIEGLAPTFKMHGVDDI